MYIYIFKILNYFNSRIPYFRFGTITAGVGSSPTVENVVRGAVGAVGWVSVDRPRVFIIASRW